MATFQLSFRSRLTKHITPARWHYVLSRQYTSAQPYILRLGHSGLSHDRHRVDNELTSNLKRKKGEINNSHWHAPIATANLYSIVVIVNVVVVVVVRGWCRREWTLERRSGTRCRRLSARHWPNWPRDGTSNCARALCLGAGVQVARARPR